MVNKEFDQSRYQAGRLEAKTRNAFLGKKHQYDLKAQFLSNPSAPVETFNPLDQKFITKLAGENPQQQERLVSFVNNFQTFESTFGPDLELQNAPLIWQAVDRIESLKSQPVREKILNQIKAKKEQAKQVAVTEPVLQPENALKTTISTIWKLQGEKFREGLKSILDLPFFIINNLPDRVYRVLPITTILALVLSACAVAVVPQSEIPNQNDPVPGETTGLPDSATGEAPVITNTVEPASTITPAPTETQVVNQVDQLLTAYLAGENIDVSVLSPTEFREFSTQLAEQRNEERGINPIIYNNEAYISPDNYMMMNYDGHPDMNETIQMYLPVVGKDSAGNLQILNQDGRTITIANSADVDDWNMVVTDPNDPRIDWPNLPNDIDGGLNEITYRLSDHPNNIGNKTFLVPAILLEKTMGQFFMEGKGTIPNFRFLTIADTDVNGEPISFRLSLVIPNSTKLAIENSDFYASTGGIMVFDHEKFFVNLQENSVYYIGVTQDQEKIFSRNHVSMAGYQGLITDSEIASILTHQTESWQDIMLLAPSVLIQKK